MHNGLWFICICILSVAILQDAYIMSKNLIKANFIHFFPVESNPAKVNAFAYIDIFHGIIHAAL